MSEGEIQIALSGEGKSGSEAVKTSVEVAPGRRVEFAVNLGDITDVDYDAIVTPANPGFEYAGMLSGVQNAIGRKAGMETFEEAERNAHATVSAGHGVKDTESGLHGVPLGFATATTAGKLERIKRIIHVNNMRTERGKALCDEEAVRLAVSSSLSVTESEHLQSVAFPAMGTGVWGMSLAESMSGTIQGMRDYFGQINPDSKIKKVGFVIYASPTLQNASEVREVLATEVLPKLR